MVAAGFVRSLTRVFGAGAEGARGLLTTVASSMITVAGVVFSITLVALSLASSQYTSRVLRNFLSDRITQSVLGIFVGIFAYCLIVLRTIRGGEEGVFVPSLAVLVGMMLGFVGIGVLIYFIHHISISIQASHILAAATEETIRAVDHLFPEVAREEDEVIVPKEVSAAVAWHSIVADQTGYFQSLDVSGVLDFAQTQETIVRMERRVGQFVIEGQTLAVVLDVCPDEEAVQRFRGLLVFGRQRTVEQDASFGVRQIVDVALKALSPGINDTTTAVMCIDRLTSILARLSGRRIDSCLNSADGTLRMITCGPTYADLVGEAFDQIRQNSAGNVAVIDRLLDSIELLASQTNSPTRIKILLDHARAVEELIHRSITASRDRQRINVQLVKTLQSLGEKDQLESESASEH